MSGLRPLLRVPLVTHSKIDFDSRGTLRQFWLMQVSLEKVAIFHGKFHKRRFGGWWGEGSEEMRDFFFTRLKKRRRRPKIRQFKRWKKSYNFVSRVRGSFFNYLYTGVSRREFGRIKHMGWARSFSGRRWGSMVKSVRALRGVIWLPKKHLERNYIGLDYLARFHHYGRVNWKESMSDPSGLLNQGWWADMGDGPRCGEGQSMHLRGDKLLDNIFGDEYPLNSPGYNNVRYDLDTYDTPFFADGEGGVKVISDSFLVSGGLNTLYTFLIMEVIVLASLVGILWLCRQDVIKRLLRLGQVLGSALTGMFLLLGVFWVTR